MRRIPASAILFALAGLLLAEPTPGEQAPAAPKSHPPIAIPFTLAAPGYVTLVIEDATGKRVRNLLSETPFPAGANTAWWDGLDDLGRDPVAATHAVYHIPGQFVTPGAYRVRGLVRPPLDLRYEFSVYHEGRPPWRTEDKGSQWLANHTPPSAVLFVPEALAPARPGKAAPGGQIVVGSKVSEGGSGVAWLDLEGRKLHGQLWIGGVWTGATQLARDDGDAPVPGVYAYSASAWRGDKYNNNKPELRLYQLLTVADTQAAPRDTRYGYGEDRPVLSPTYELPPLASPESEGIEHLSGLAVRDGLVVVAFGPCNLLLFVDAKERRVLGTVPLESPRGLAYDSAGRFFVISGRRVLRYPALERAARLPEPTAVVTAGLEDPQQLVLDNDGNLYVSDLGDSHQVKVFSPAGALLRCVGKPGRPGVGPYDPEHLNNPAGLTLDSRHRLWVAEHEYAPKRVSVWSLDGKLQQAFYGPPRYGGGGRLDGVEPTRFFYADAGGIEFALDWQTGRSVPTAVYYRAELDTLKLPRRGNVAPEQPLHAGGRTYLTDAYNENPTGGSSTVSLWQLENGVARPVAAIGQANDWSVLHETARFCVRWTGQVQAQVAGDTVFAVFADDGARLWVNGAKVLDNWRSHRGEDAATAVKLEAGRRYDLRLEYYQRGGGANARLLWSAPGLAKQVVPTAALFPDAAATAAGGLRAEYFSGNDFRELLESRIDARVDFDFAAGGLHLARPSPFAARLPAGLDLHKDRVIFAWSDRNGDGQPQPGEVSLAPGETRAVSLMADLSAVTASGLLLKPQGFAPGGAPLYDAAQAIVLASGTQRPTSSGGGQALLGSDGWLVLTTAPKPFAPQGFGGVRGGVASWSYPSLWPGLHAGHSAPLPEFPGEVLGSTRLLGLPVRPPGTDTELWAINGDKGNIYLFTTDGLFVATLFKDGRSASWKLPQAERGMLLNDVSTGAESFWPSIAQTPDGRVYLVVNWPSIVRLDGLDGIRRLPDAPLTVTAAQLQEANAWFVQHEAERQAVATQKRVWTVTLRQTAPEVDGRLDEWAKADWALIDERRQQVGDWGHRQVRTEAALAVAGDRLYAAYRTTDRDLLANAAEALPMLFKSGGALDLMLGTDPGAAPQRPTAVPGDLRLLVTRSKGQPLAVLYRPVVPGTASEPFAFASPLRTIRFDRVDNVTADVVLASSWQPDPKDNSGRLGQAGFEFSIPLATLGLTPRPGLVLRADVGVLRGNGVETLQRAYWSNKASGITADVPSEAELLPRLWGELHFALRP